MTDLFYSFISSKNECSLSDDTQRIGKQGQLIPLFFLTNGYVWNSRHWRIRTNRRRNKCWIEEHINCSQVIRAITLVHTLTIEWHAPIDTRLWVSCHWTIHCVIVRLSHSSVYIAMEKDESCFSIHFPLVYVFWECSFRRNTIQQTKAVFPVSNVLIPRAIH